MHITEENHTTSLHKELFLSNADYSFEMNSKWLLEYPLSLANIEILS